MSDEDSKSWIYAGGLPYEFTEGDVICIFSQYGEIFEISLARDKETGKSRGFCFIKYEDHRSCELSVDNLNGATITGRKIKVSPANNTNAVKSRKATVVAPTESSTLPQVEDIHKFKRDMSPEADRQPLLRPKYLEQGDRRDDVSDRRRQDQPLTNLPARLEFQAELGRNSRTEISKRSDQHERSDRYERSDRHEGNGRHESNDRHERGGRHERRDHRETSRYRSPVTPPRSSHRRRRRDSSTSSSSSSAPSGHRRQRSRHRSDHDKHKKSGHRSSRHHRGEHKSSSSSSRHKSSEHREDRRRSRSRSRERSSKDKSRNKRSKHD